MEHRYGYHKNTCKTKPKVGICDQLHVSGASPTREMPGTRCGAPRHACMLLPISMPHGPSASSPHWRTSPKGGGPKSIPFWGIMWLWGGGESQ